MMQPGHESLAEGVIQETSGCSEYLDPISTYWINGIEELTIFPNPVSHSLNWK